MSAEQVELVDEEGSECSRMRLLPDVVSVSLSGTVEGHRGLDSAGGGWRQHVSTWSRRPRGGRWLVDVASSAELRGCGGGYFPAARKWRRALDHQEGPILVVNAAESEWLSAKDAALLSLHPHLVLDGAAMLAETLGARTTVVWMHESAWPSRRSVEVAYRDRAAHGAHEPPVDLVVAPAAYLSGESSAIKRALRGGPVLPHSRLTRDRRAGAEILVHNVETLARLALLALAPSTYRPARSRLLTVLSPAHERRVVEVAAAVPLARAVEIALVHRPDPATPVLLGGYGGTWARWSDVADLPVDEDAMRLAGHPLGPGIVAPLWQDGCGIGVTAGIVSYLARSSAGQCGPCVFGLAAMAQSLTRLTNGRARQGELRLLRRDLDAVAGRGACHNPDGAVHLVRSALEVFAGDVALHASGGSCGRPSVGLVPIPAQGSDGE